jgi:chemotaxis protein CheX
MNSTSEVLADGTVHQSTVHQKWIPLLEVAAQEVFELMLGCKLTSPDGASDSQPDITAMVGLAGQLCGVLSIRCDHKSAALMASKMLGIEVDLAGTEMCDAFGEVCNMVAGNFKNKIAGLGDGCMLSVPTVITGTEYDLYSPTETGRLEVKFLFEGLPMTVSLEVNG